MPTQNVNLTPELDCFVKEQVATGYFNNASEVHRAALAALAKAEEKRKIKLQRLKIEVQKGWDDIEAGRSIETNGPEELDRFMEGCFNDALQRLEKGRSERTA